MHSLDTVIERDVAKMLRLLTYVPKLQALVRGFDGDSGFMFGFDESLPDDVRVFWNAISNQFADSGHSGASWGFMCRRVQYELQNS
jgi:hypothetical protein